jgi:D-alanine-D-alanine ligase
VSNNQPAAEISIKRPSVGVITAGNTPGTPQLRGAEAIREALSEQGFDAVLVDVQSGADPLALLRAANLDTAFLAASDTELGPGCLQGLLEFLGIPYTGSSVLSSALSEDRVKTKEMLRLHNIPALPYYEVKAEQLDSLESVHGLFGFPVAVRPRGRNDGARRANNLGELEAAVQVSLEHAGSVVVERVIAGDLYAVAILEGRVLGATPVSATETGMKLAASRMRGVLNIAEHAAEALDCRGAVTVELLVTEFQNEFVTAVDSRPLLEPNSVYARIAASAGYEFSSLCARLARASRLDLAPQARANVTNLPVVSAEEPIRIAV